MAAQAALEQDKSSDAEGTFLAAADSAATEAQRIAQWSATPRAAAHALVGARAAQSPQQTGHCGGLDAG